jgi:hypothetical protein
LGSSYSSFPSPTRTLLNTTANNSNNGLLSSPITLPLHQDILLRGKPVLSPIRSLAGASDRSRDQPVDDLGKLQRSPSSWKKLHATITIRRKHTSSSSSSSNNNNLLAPLLDGAASLQGLFGQSLLQDLEARLDSSGLNKITLQLISQEIDPSMYIRLLNYYDLLSALLCMMFPFRRKKTESREVDAPIKILPLRI